MTCLIPALPLLLAGCGDDASDVAEKADRSVRSWSATVDMLAEQRAGERVPGLYVEQTLDAVGDGIDDVAKSLKKIPPADPRHVDLDRRLDALRRRVRQMQATSEHPRQAAYGRPDDASSRGGRRS